MPDCASPRLGDMVPGKTGLAWRPIWRMFIRDGEGVEDLEYARRKPPVAGPPAARRRKTRWRLASPRSACFPTPRKNLRTEDCAEAWNPDNLTNRAIRMLKAELPELMVMTDIALDPYNANGHDGFVVDGQIVNDETVDALVKMGLAQADAGADILGAV